MEVLFCMEPSPFSATMSASTQRWHPRALQEGTKQASTFAVAIPFILITTLVMGLRLHVRLRLVQGGLGTDDRRYWPDASRVLVVTRTDLLLIGYIFTVALSTATMLCGWYGVGAHGTTSNHILIVSLLKC